MGDIADVVTGGLGGVAAGVSGVGQQGLDILSGKAGAEAAGKAAVAQERQAQANLDFAKESQGRAVRAADSPQEMAALERSLAHQERNIGRSERLLSSVDPTLMEASRQALRLLRGEEAAGGGVLREQRKRQRAQLVDQLRRQLGPGAETSSAGIQALTQFDQASSSVFAQNQQASLGQLLQSTQASSGQGRQGAATGAAGVGQTGGLFGNIAQRKVNAFIGAGQQVGQAAAGATGVAGSQFVGEQLAAQGQTQLAGSVLSGGMQAGASFLGGG